MLLNPVPPEFKVCVPVAFVNVTVLPPGVKVPPVLDQLPDTLKVLDGAVSVPLEIFTSVAVIVPVDPVKVPPEIIRAPVPVVTAPEEAVNVPDETVRPPLRDCEAVDPWYVPPFTVLNPVTVKVCPLEFSVPEDTNRVPLNEVATPRETELLPAAPEFYIVRLAGVF